MTSKHHSILLYGPPGAGKTAMAVSSFWDWEKEVQIRNGRVLLIGREECSHLNVPDELVKRFVSPKESPVQFVRGLAEYMQKLVMETAQGRGLDVLVVDGFSEWSTVFEQAKEVETGESKDQWVVWKALKKEFIRLVQYLNPEDLKCHVIGTARVATKREGHEDKVTKEVKGADPEWFDSIYVPDMDGWARQKIGHYFQFVLYQDTGKTWVKEGPKRVQARAHLTHLVQDGDYLVKNALGHRWRECKLPSVLVNGKFDDLLECLEAARERRLWKEGNDVSTL